MKNQYSVLASESFAVLTKPTIVNAKRMAQLQGRVFEKSTIEEVNTYDVCESIKEETALHDINVLTLEEFTLEFNLGLNQREFMVAFVTCEVPA